MAFVLSLLLAAIMVQELRAEERAISAATGVENPRLCAANKTAHFLIWNSAAKGSPPIYQLGLCDSVRGEGFKLRAISRKELSDAFVQSRHELRPNSEPARVKKEAVEMPTPEEFWSTVGIGKDQLKPAAADPKIKDQKDRYTSLDMKISSQVMVFPHSEDLKSLQRAAEWLKQSQNVLSETVVLPQASSDVVLTDWFQAFESLCRTAGGSWTEKREVDIAGGIALDNQTLLDRATKAVKDSLQGKPVCQCRNVAFSNPVDYRCRVASKGRIFEEANEIAPKESDMGSSSQPDIAQTAMPEVPRRSGGRFNLKQMGTRR